jgi:hypothetical protein
LSTFLFGVPAFVTSLALLGWVKFYPFVPDVATAAATAAAAAAAVIDVAAAANDTGTVVGGGSSGGIGGGGDGDGGDGNVRNPTLGTAIVVTVVASLVTLMYACHTFPTYARSSALPPPLQFDDLDADVTRNVNDDDDDDGDGA